MANRIVGLDIGSSGLRAAEFTLGRRPRLRTFATAPLPADAIRAGTVVDGAAVTDTLRTLWSRARFSTRTVTFGVADEGVLVRHMELDWMPPADFRKALRYQVADALPVPVDEANLDYHVLGEAEVPGELDGQTKRVVRIMLAAAARQSVDGFVDAVQQAGLRPVRADLMPFALVRASQASAATDAQEAIIDIGSDTVTVTVHQHGQPRFVRLVSGVGSDRITQALQARYGWSWEEAERTKVTLGLPAPSVAPDEPSRPHPAQQVISEQADELVREVRATLDFFLKAEEPADDLDRGGLGRIVLAGSGARLHGLAARLAEQTGVPVEPLSPLAGLRKRRRLKLDDEQLAQLAVPAGLCMGVSA